PGDGVDEPGLVCVDVLSTWTEGQQREEAVAAAQGGGKPVALAQVDLGERGAPAPRCGAGPITHEDGDLLAGREKSVGDGRSDVACDACDGEHGTAPSMVRVVRTSSFDVV